MRNPRSAVILVMALGGISAALGSGLPAQVVIHEVNLTPQGAGDDQWIEIINLGKSTQDLSNWSIYQATKTANKPQNYWFGIPSRTNLPGETIMRVHWGATITSSTNPLDIQTGNSVKNFLFGLGWESLDPKGGALALLNTNMNSNMNKASSFVDWVSWGSSGFKRESLAIEAGLWKKDQFIKAPTAKESIALATFLQAEPTPASAFFLDHTPTPLAGNHNGFLADTHNTKSCAVGNANPAQLWFEGVPAAGNDDFALTVANTRGPGFKEGIFLLFNTARGSSQSFGGCPVHVKSIETSLLFGPISADFNSTRIPFSLNVAGIGGARANCQAFVGSALFNFDLSLSNVMELAIGR